MPDVFPLILLCGGMMLLLAAASFFSKNYSLVLPISKFGVPADDIVIVTDIDTIEEYIAAVKNN